MPTSLLNLMVGTDHPVPVLPQGGTASVSVISGSSVFYADTLGVSSSNNQGSIAAGSSASFSSPVWLRSSGSSAVRVTVDSVAAVQGGRVVAPTVLAIGSSIVGNNGADWPVSGTPPATTISNPNGYVTWACALSDGRLRFVKNAGSVVGPTSAQTLSNVANSSNAQFCTAISPAPGIVVIGEIAGDDGVNPTPAQGLANTIAVTQLMMSTYPNAIIVLTTLPGVTGNATQRQTINPGLRAFAAANPVLLLDIEAITLAPLTGLYVAGYSQDTIHPNPTGAMIIGRALFNMLSPYLPQGNGFINDYTNDPRVSVASGGWTTDAMMPGTPGANTTATNWSVALPAGATRSLVARSDQYGNWQRVVYGGTAGALSVFRAYGAMPAGAVLQAECEVQCHGDWTASGVTECSLSISTSLGNGCLTFALGNGLANSGPYTDPGNGQILGIRSQPITVPAGGSSSGFVGMGINGTAVAGSIDVGRFSLIRLA